MYVSGCKITFFCTLGGVLLLMFFTAEERLVGQSAGQIHGMLDTYRPKVEDIGSPSLKALSELVGFLSQFADKLPKAGLFCLK